MVRLAAVRRPHLRRLLPIAAALFAPALALAQGAEWRYFTPEESVVRAFAGDEPTTFRFCAIQDWDPSVLEHPVVSSIGSIGRYRNLDDGIAKTRAGACEVLVVPWHLVQQQDRTLSEILGQGFVEIPVTE